MMRVRVKLDDLLALRTEERRLKAETQELRRALEGETEYRRMILRKLLVLEGFAENLTTEEIEWRSKVWGSNYEEAQKAVEALRYTAATMYDEIDGDAAVALGGHVGRLMELFGVVNTGPLPGEGGR